jgi:hypothetical protein
VLLAGLDQRLVDGATCKKAMELLSLASYQATQFTLESMGANSQIGRPALVGYGW